MEKINFNYSLKNIPIPSKKEYKLKLMEKIESVIKRMRWKAHFFINGDSDENNDTSNKNTFGFKSKKYPSQSKELESFERDLYNMAKNIKFRNINDQFQQSLKQDISKINASKKLFIPADKTTNMYELSPEEYNKLLKDNVTKTYQKATPRLEKAINLEAKQIAKTIKLDDRIECLAKNPAFVTLKDHKSNFRSSTPCRLINPCKSELGKVSKAIVEKINKSLITSLGLNQWKNSDMVIDWFKSINNKHECTFIQLDIMEFYPSITETILDNAISFAKTHINISDKDLRIIKHCRKSLLYHANEAWKKKDSDTCFDVTMGSFDGAEICELIGCFILFQLITINQKDNQGLYRDDALILVRNLNGQKIDKLRKDIIKVFQNIGFKIEIHTNLKVVDFLDITFNLTNGTYKPYKKPNDQLLYVNTSSNHPPQIIKQLPSSTAERLSKHSSNEEIFNSSKLEYEKALKESGYKTFHLNYSKPTDIPKRNNRTRNIIWFNPPFNKTVTTNVAKNFLKLLDQHFPNTHKLHKIFNRNTIKVSYSCTENMSGFIRSHNNKIINGSKNNIKPCNCRIKSECPLDGKCQIQNVVYKCTVETKVKPTKEYLGTAEGDFKQRHYNHKKSFKNKYYRNETTLSKFVWEIREKYNEEPVLKWSIVRTVPGYSNISKRCLLCLYEKFEILHYSNPENLLNKRSELVSNCRHVNKFLLKNYKSND